MIFEINEVIELSKGERYIVAYRLEEKYTWYYYLLKINDDDTVLDDSKIVTTKRIGEKLYINEIHDESINELFKRLKESV